MKRFTLFILIVITFSCIDAVDLSLPSSYDKLVIDGLVTNEPGPYTIRIGRSLPFDNTKVLPAYFNPEANAIVSIDDNLGNSFALTETGPGLYVTPAHFTGGIGVTYTLKIRTADGKKYQSDPELMRDVPAIDSLIYTYITYQRLTESGSGNIVETTSTGFQLTVKSNDPNGLKNYYRWKVSGIFEYFSINDNPEIKQCWAPVFRLETHVKVNNDHYFDGNSFLEDVAIIPYERPSYYLAAVKQYSISARAYEFWNQFKNQQLNTGSIFDPPPVAIRGNMKNIDDDSDMVLGYFGVSAVYEKSVLINRFIASGRVSPSPYIMPIGGDCRDHEPRGTNIKPPGFP
ncbi:MAG: DUF4249 domain-containing protein [Bacteroidota bacterium]